MPPSVLEASRDRVHAEPAEWPETDTHYLIARAMERHASDLLVWPDADGGVTVELRTLRPVLGTAYGVANRLLPDGTTELWLLRGGRQTESFRVEPDGSAHNADGRSLDDIETAIILAGLLNGRPTAEPLS